MRHFLGLLILRNAPTNFNFGANFWGATDRIHRLEEEVRLGQSIVMITGAGELQRVTALVVLHVKNASGEIFVELGKWVSGKAQPSCKLPGAKMKEGELPADSMRRMLKEELWPLKNGVSVSSVEKMIGWQYSQK